MKALAARGAVLLRGAAVLLALLLHGVVLGFALWPRDRPPPLVIEAVPVVLSGATGEAEEGTGAPPTPAAPAREAVAAQPAPLSAPVPPEPAPPAPGAERAAAVPPPPAEPLPEPPAPAELPLPAPQPPSPQPPSPEPPSPEPPAPARPSVAAPAPAPRPPPAPPPQPAAPGQVRLGAGTALDINPGPETRAARPRDLACSDSIEYPPELRQAGIGGDVVLRLRLTDKGRVIEARVAESSGHPQLDEAVQRSVRRCRFDPALRDGAAVWSSLTFRATLRPF